MKRLVGKEFVQIRDLDLPDQLSEVELVGCRFERCGYGKTSEVTLPRRISNVRLVDCSLDSVSLGVVRVSEVECTGLQTSENVFCRGTVFEHVRFSGRCGEFTLQCSNDVVLKGRDEIRGGLPFRDGRFLYENIDWAVDISTGEFESMDIRGIPSYLIRRDPEAQVVISRDRVLRDKTAVLSALADHPTAKVSVNMLLSSGWRDLVFVAGRASTRFREKMAAVLVQREPESELSRVHTASTF